jgi:hypothetical protein
MRAVNTSPLRAVLALCGELPLGAAALFDMGGQRFVLGTLGQGFGFAQLALYLSAWKHCV